MEKTRGGRELKRTAAAIAAILFFFPVYGQDGHTLKGKVINSDGGNVEYVAIGIPGSGVSTISTAEGEFELSIPQSHSADTIEFHHVSYLTGYVSPQQYMQEDSLVVTLRQNELPEIVVTDKDAKEKTLVNKGSRFPLAAAVMSPGNVGQEIGSNVKVKRKFLVQEFSFTVESCSVSECKMSLNVYKVTGDSFENILNRPVYIDIERTERTKKYVVEPNEILLLEPGRYFVSLAYIHCSDEDRAYWNEMKTWTGRKYMEAVGKTDVTFPLYIKSSYLRDTVLGDMSKNGFNMGLSVTGLEYRE